MTKQEILEVLLLLSALESWSFAQGQKMPEYLADKLDESVAKLTEKVLEVE